MTGPRETIHAAARVRPTAGRGYLRGTAVWRRSLPVAVLCSGALTCPTAQAQAPRRWEIPWPEVPSPRDAPWPTQTGEWRLGKRPRRWFLLRLGTGVSVRAAGPGDTVAFALDVDAGGVFGLHRGVRPWALLPLVGASLRAPSDEVHLSAGVGLAWGASLDTDQWTLTARALWDTATGTPGVRTAVQYRFAQNGFSVELGHQAVPARGEHEIRASVGVDLGLLVDALVD